MNKPVSENRAKQLQEQWEQKLQGEIYHHRWPCLICNSFKCIYLISITACCTHIPKELKDYKDIHGDVNIPANGPNNTLGKWVMNQRYYYKEQHQGRKNSLTPERIQDLENVS